MVNDRYLDGASSKDVLKHVERLWGFDVQLETVDARNTIKALFRKQCIVSYSK
jgi:spore cortex formation protein SpoVR/YcgB (stage V sporulation)